MNDKIKSDDIMVHLGVIGRLDFPKHVSANLDKWDFVVDGDSFTVWGERLTNPLNVGEPIHITNRGSKSAGEPPRGWLQFRDLLIRCLDDTGYRVIDYIVLTDADDWSEDAEIIGAFA